MPKAIIVGEREAILPFKAAGVELSPVETVEEARRVLRRLAATLEEGVVFLPEAWAVACGDELALLRRKPLVAAAALAIPVAVSGDGRTGSQWETVRDLVRRAIGVDRLGPRSGVSNK